jgi:alkaline phosphatase
MWRVGMILEFCKKKLPLLVFAVCLWVVGSASHALATNESTTRNVIVFMADGMGTAHTTITRWYKGSPLALDRMFLGGMRTHSADSLITDSAPAATAFATGHKTNDKYVGVLPDPTRITIPGIPINPPEFKEKPVATVLEGAKLMGKSVGLVATSNIQHASPAGYSAHWPDRGNYNEIAEQQVYLGIDVVFGGGKQYLVPSSQGGKRTDGENLIDVLKSREYGFVENRSDLLSFNGQKVWGMFAEDDMFYELDRRVLAPHQPSLGEMTRKAIEILSRNTKGFFLFVEGSKIDWASHANDPIGVISDLLAFDEAVGISLDFAKQNGNTLVVAFSDHGNGGMSLGSKKTDSTYSKLPVSALVDPLKKASLTGEGIEIILGGDFTDAGKLKAVMEEYYGIKDLTDKELAAIQATKKKSLNSTVGPMISNRSVIGWTTTGHGGEDLFVYYYGINTPMGMIDNTDIARITADFMDLNLAKIDQELFVPADELFGMIGATTYVDYSEQKKKALMIKKDPGEKPAIAMIPFNKDILMCNDKTYRMPGITIYAPNTGKVYISREALQLFQYCEKARSSSFNTSILFPVPSL